MITVQTDDERLIRHLKEYYHDADTTSFSVLDFASAFGSPLSALVYAKLFWPDFVEFEGMVFHSSILESEEDRSLVLSALARNMSPQDVEKSFNSFDIPSSFFASNRGGTTFDENLLLARTLQEAWQHRLEDLFPGRRLLVDLSVPEGESPNLSVFQDRRM